MTLPTSCRVKAVLERFSGLLFIFRCRERQQKSAEGGSPRLEFRISFSVHVQWGDLLSSFYPCSLIFSIWWEKYPAAPIVLTLMLSQHILLSFLSWGDRTSCQMETAISFVYLHWEVGRKCRVGRCSRNSRHHPRSSLITTVEGK